MKILIGAALGALLLGASPASAQLYKAGTVTATPRTLAQERADANRRPQKPAARTFHKPGTATFRLEPARRRAEMAGSPEAPPPAKTVPGEMRCCERGKAPADGAGHDM